MNLDAKAWATPLAWVVVFSLVSACGATDHSGCTETSRTLLSDERGKNAVSATDVLDVFGHYDGELRWMPSETLPHTPSEGTAKIGLVVADARDAKDVSVSVADLETDDPTVCADHLRFTARVTLTSSDGAFDEMTDAQIRAFDGGSWIKLQAHFGAPLVFNGGLQVPEGSSLTLYHELHGDSVRGSLVLSSVQAGTNEGGSKAYVATIARWPALEDSL